MPLVIVTGRPATGKTTVAEHLVHFLRTQKKYCDVELVNEESLQIQKASGYAGKGRFDSASYYCQVQWWCNEYIQMQAVRR